MTGQLTILSLNQTQLDLVVETNSNSHMRQYNSVSAHKVPHLQRGRTLEVQEVRLRVLCLVSATPCKQIQKNLCGFIEKLHNSNINNRVVTR